MARANLRGLIGNLGDRLVVASPIYKQHFDLRTGACLEAPENAVARFDAEVRDGEVWVHGNAVADANALSAESVLTDSGEHPGADKPVDSIAT